MKTRSQHTHTFHIDYLSEVDGMRYEGSFTTKKLSIRDIAALGSRKSQLGGGMHHDPNFPGKGLDADTDSMNQTVAFLEIAIQKAPPWWNLDNITDTDLLAKIYEEAFSFETSFLRGKQQGEESGRAGEAGSPSTTDGANNGGNSGSLVGEEVQAALKP
jgi:hypothetical protein